MTKIEAKKKHAEFEPKEEILKRISAVFLRLIIASLVCLVYQPVFAEDSISGVWKGRYTEVWKSHDNSVHEGELVLDLNVNGTEVSGLVFSKDDEETFEFDYLDMIPTEKGTWTNERLELEWGDKITLVADVRDDKLVGTYRYYWEAGGGQYEDWEGSFELTKEAQ